MPISHISLPVRDLQASKAFYLATLAPLGYSVYKEFEAVIGMGPKYGAPDLWLHKCPEEKDGDKAAVAKTHVAFQASRKADVGRFYAAALKAGGKSNGEPGERPQYVKGYYAAFVLDPDGNNVECMYWQPLWLVALQNAPMLVGAAAIGVAWWAGKSGWMVG